MRLHGTHLRRLALAAALSLASAAGAAETRILYGGSVAPETPRGKPS